MIEWLNIEDTTEAQARYTIHVAIIRPHYTIFKTHVYITGQTSDFPLKIMELSKEKVKEYILNYG